MAAWRGRPERTTGVVPPLRGRCSGRVGCSTIAGRRRRRAPARRGRAHDARERRRARRLGRCSATTAGRELLFALTDEVLRTPDAAPLDGPAPRPRRRRAPAVAAGARPRRAAPGRAGSSVAPGPVAAIVRRRIRAETRGVIIPAADPAFARHVARRRVRRLRRQRQPARRGDPRRRRGRGPPRRAVRADAPARRRLRLGEDLGAVRQPRRARLRPRGRAHRRPPARRSTTSPPSSQPPVFVNLDMEEYRDLHLTVAAFRRVLDEPRFADAAGGHRPPGVPARHPRRRSTTCWPWVAERHRARRRRRSRCASSRAPTWRWSTSTPSSAGGCRRRTRTKADVDASYKALLDRLLDAAADGGLHRRRRQPQPVRRGLGARRARPPRARRRGRHRDARGHGAAAVAGDAGRRRRRAALHAGRHRRGLRGQHRLPLAPARRERRPGELPPLAVHDHPRLAGVARRAAALRGRRRRRARRCRADAAAHAGPARASDRRFDPDAPFANEPDTDFTQAANRAWISRAPRTPTARPSCPRSIDDDRGHRRASSGGHATAPRAGARRRRPSGAARSPGSPR